MEITTVSDSAAASDFLMLPHLIYQNDNNYIRPWDHEIQEVFDSKKNKYFRHGECNRWILKNAQGQVIGRIAAFINKRTADKDKVGGIGFFECIDDQSAANLLFDTAKSWLNEKGMVAMDGPINFGEKDKWWGLLVDGFKPPTYGMNYNPPYYKQLFDNYGFKTYYEQYIYNYVVQKPVPDKFGEKADRLARDEKYRFEYLDKNQLDKYATYFYEVYNAAWGKTPGFKSIPLEQAKNILKKIKPIMDPKLIWFGFYGNKPIAFFIMLPEINQAIKKLNGKFSLWHKLYFMYLLKFTKTVNKCFGVVFGVVPEFQGKGLEGGIVKAAEKVVQPLNRYTDLEMTWIGSFNPKMITIVESLGTTKIKTLHTMRYLFDRNAEFKTHPVL